MDIEAFVSQVLADQTPPLPDTLSDEVADALVERLKSEADRHWRIDAHVSLRCADVIIHVGQTLENSRIIALGLMARGDALKLLNHTEEAWETLERAGALYLSVGDEVGWARTRIGRLGICVNLNRVDVAMREAEQAREIFLRHGEQEKLLRLNSNAAAVYDQIGDFRESIALYNEALHIAEQLGEAGHARLGMLYNNMGYAQRETGNLQQALHYYEIAQNLLEERREISNAALAKLNIATVVQAQGQYRKALKLLYPVQEFLATHLPVQLAYAQRSLIECYLSLNRFDDVCVLAQKFLSEHELTTAGYNLPVVQLHLATAEARLGDFENAQNTLSLAESVLTELGAEALIATVQLLRGHIALQQGDLVKALQKAVDAAEFFEANAQQVDFAAARLLIGQVKLAKGELEEIEEIGNDILQIARRENVLWLYYGTHLLLGQVAERQNRWTRAVRHYQAAVATIERAKRSLTITLRTVFLEDKQDASRSLIRLYLEHSQPKKAFEALERAKSQLWLSYLTNREELRWVHDDPYTRPLIEELQRLREEHHWFYRLAYDQAFREVQHISIQPQQAVHEVADRERQMRSLTERLYLYSEQEASVQVGAVDFDAIQARLASNSVLIEFYSDGTRMWVFCLDKETLRVKALPVTSEVVGKLVEQLQANFARAIRAGAQTKSAEALTRLARQILQQAYGSLIAPIEDLISNCERLVIVPYGVLHYLPFHLLYSGENYLLETHEVVVLPAAGLLTQTPPQRDSAALILAHTWEGRLPNTIAEAELVSHRLNGVLCCDEQANQSVFATSPSQILHIAAHGQHRIDQPDFSYIQLADGQLLTDDLLQYDLSYELVVLSACETGRANVAAGDELIGLGRGFLYAGAGALVASLWRVDDTVTVQWMDKFYDALQAGQSKAAALRHASLAILGEQPWLHPAFWGAFQLIGNAEPLSTFATH